MHCRKHSGPAALLVALLAAGSLAACTSINHTAPKSAPPDNAHEVRVKQTAPSDEGARRAAATEQRLEQLAEQIPEVKHANCVIMGETAIVGIDVGGELDRSRVGTIKYAVAESLRQDPIGIHAIVTADMDLYHRLQEIKQDLANGRPMQGVAEELADIVGRIIPQLPLDTREGDSSPPPRPDAVSQEQGANEAGKKR